MPNSQGPSKSGRKEADRAKKERSPQSPGYDKKLDGPNRPST
ncbi:spore protein [Cohnella abietis]|uniref:Uncharacterized protein n=1 Tax=Cohnella abietis TaxID=2507935 RepID=A0A3T1DCF8_9BACL|nr:spore protein [Cohnella abietis]BBI35779.1 hypothetical protein KCTCHS21_51780 [Cohnella abietis]